MPEEWSWTRPLITDDDSCVDLDSGTDAIPPHIATNLIDAAAGGGGERGTAARPAPLCGGVGGSDYLGFTRSKRGAGPGDHTSVRGCRG